MSTSRRHHWLPVAYLQFFSISGTPLGHQTEVYAASSEGSWRTSAEAVCAEWDLYSRIDPVGADASFHQIEGSYAALIRRIDTPLSNDDRTDLLLRLFHLWIRSPLRRNESGAEFIEVLHPMHYAFFWSELAGILEPNDPADREALVRAIEKRWALQIVRSPRDPFITSDNPVKLFGVGGSLTFAFLPITPRHALVANNRELVSISSLSASHDDLAVLNSVQVRTCIRQVYADHDLSPDLPTLRGLMGVPGPRFGRIGSDSFTAEYHQYTADELSFVSRRSQTGSTRQRT